MARKRFTAGQIIMKLSEAEVGLAQGQTVGQVSKQIGVTEQTYYRWRKECGGLRMDQAKRLKVLEKENTRLKKQLGTVKLTGFRGTKPPYQVFRSGFTTHILGLSQLVMR